MFHKTRRAPAKVNLTLDVTGRAANGYHLLASVFHETDLADLLSLETEWASPSPQEKEGEEAVQDSESLQIPFSLQVQVGRELPADNTVYRAQKIWDQMWAKRRLLLDQEDPRRKLRPRYWNWTIEKHIPEQAGLGGGSADAAAALHLLNELYGFPLTQPELEELGLQIGMDVPFCLRGGCALLEGVGGELKALPTATGVPLLLFKPPTGMPTAWAYNVLDCLNPREVQDYRPQTEAFIQAWERQDQRMWRYSGNVFEAVVAEAMPGYGVELQRFRYQGGCLEAHLTGAGSASWAVYSDPYARDLALETPWLAGHGLWLYAGALG